MFRFILLSCVLISTLNTSAFAQVFIINENFASASFNNPPAGWTTYSLNGGVATDIWRFDNPANRQGSFPLTAPYAIFDGAHYSNNSSPEDVVLESPSFDASISNGIYLIFEEWFSTSLGATAIVEGYNGVSWGPLATITQSSENGRRRIVDASSRVGGVTNAKLRFRFTGNGAGFWIVDNIRVLAPLNVDAGVTRIQSPAAIINPGIQPVNVAFTNFGYSNITGVTIGWSVNGVRQPDYLVSGQNLPFWDTLANNNIGAFNFPAGMNVLKVWTQSPNGLTDPNRLNDTVTRVVAVTLCGTYTIGGNNPDFATFSDAATVLNNAGITCPVVFRVRPGFYDEQLALGNIPGSDSVNTIRFESVNGDSSTTVLRYNQSNNILDYALKLTRTSYVGMYQIGVERNSNSTSISISDSCKALVFAGCKIGPSQINVNRATSIGFFGNRIEGSIQINLSKGIRIEKNFISGSFNSGLVDSVQVYGNYMNGASFSEVVNTRIDSNVFEAGSVLDVGTDMGKYGNTYITRNVLQGIPNGYQPVILSAYGDYIREISSNRITRVINGRGMVISADSTLISNNFIQTEGQGQGVGIEIYSQRNKIFFNSTHVANSDSSNSAGLLLQSGVGHTIKNNIFANSGLGYPVRINQILQNTEWDYNNYYSPTDRVVRYQNQRYFTTQSWGIAVAGEANALNVNPFFAAVDSYKPYQRALNGAGIAAGNILLDIEGEIRNQQAPDIGADEFMIDFGITELISPGLSCERNQIDSVTIYLRQFGDVPFVDLRLAYQVNSGPVSIDTIPGSIMNDLIYTFSAPTNLMGYGTYTLKIWLIDTYDDNVNNDTLFAIRRTYPTPIMPVNPLKCFETVTFANQIQVPTPHVIDSIWWYFGDGDSIKSLRPVHRYPAYGRYSVRVVAFASSGCIEDTIFELNLDTPAAVKILAPDTLCQGDLYYAQADDSLLVYSWQINGGQLVGLPTDSILAFRFNQTGPGYLVLSFVDQDSCARITDTLFVYVQEKDSIQLSPIGGVFSCIGDTTLLLLSGNLDSLSIVSWYFNDSLLINPSSVQLAASDTGRYYAVSLHPNGCADTSDVVNLMYHPQMNPTINILQGNTSLCPGDTLWLEASASGIRNVNWFEQTSNVWLDSTQSISITAAGSYYAVVVDSNGCVDSTAQLFVNKFPVVPVQLQMSNSNICSGDSAFLSFVSDTRLAPVWYLDGAVIASGSDSLFASESGWYRISVLDVNGCRQFSDSVYLDVLNFDSPVVTGSLAYCFGDTLRLNVPDVIGRTYFWRLPDSGLFQGSDYVVMNVDSSHLGAYEVYFTQNGCFSDTARFTITVVPPLTAPDVMGLYVGCEGGFFEVKPGWVQSNVELVWILPSMDTVVSSSLQFANLSLVDSGIYQVYTRNGNCNSAIVNVKMRVFERDAVSFPNAFTPNNDGFNDDFGPFPAVYEDEYTFTIFSRWGKMVYQTNQFGAAWDGFVGNVAAEPGEYIFHVVYKNCNGERIQKQGALKLQR